MSIYKANYRIEILDKAPSMSHSVAARVSGTYQEAVNIAHEIFQQARLEESKKVGNKTYSRAVSLHGEYDVYTWHHISMSGEVTDQNTNSGVNYPTYQ